MRVRFLSVAARELTEANDYYRSISPDLCRRFISEINAAIGRIKSNPTAWSPIGAKHRRCRTNNFPYGLIYTFLDEDALPGRIPPPLGRMSQDRALSLTLKVLAPVFLAVSLFHLWLGLGAEALLGAIVPPEAFLDASLDSQNRFYGVAFSVYGVVLFICAQDLRKYASILRALLWVFFAAGLARLVSISTHGLPSAPVLFLLGTELILPPLLLIWLRRVLTGA